MGKYGSKSVLIKANAKVNLALDIKGRASNGYHLIDSVMCKVNLADTVKIDLRDDDRITIAYAEEEVFRNDTAMIMANLLQKHFNLKGFDIFIEKKIPLSSGLGGSSADAAGVARGLKKLFNLDISNNLLLKVGSDIPFMTKGSACRVQGMGEILQDIDLPPLFIALIVDKAVKIDTKSAYDTYDIVGGDCIDIAKFIPNLDSPKNALEKASTLLEPRIKALKDLMLQSQFKNVVMTGSGGGIIAYERDKGSFDKSFALLEKAVKEKGGIDVFSLTTEEL